jgi:hypothetical protein
MLKPMVAVLVGLVLTMTAYPATAYVVMVTASVPAQSVADDDDFEAALKAAIDDVLKHVVAFTPAFVTVQNARAVGGRVYILLLIGDEDGVATLKALSDASETTTH